MILYEDIMTRGVIRGEIKHCANGIFWFVWCGICDTLSVVDALVLSVWWGRLYIVHFLWQCYFYCYYYVHLIHTICLQLVRPEQRSSKYTSNCLTFLAFFTLAQFSPSNIANSIIETPN